MKYTVWSEMKRSIFNWTSLSILLLELALVLYHHYFYRLYYVENGIGTYMFITSYSWIGFRSSNEFQFLLICMPIIATLPFSTSYLVDKANNFKISVRKEVFFKTYLFSKYIVTFCSGGFIFSFPLIVSFLICEIFSPYGIPNSHINIIFMYICINFLFAGLMAVLGLGISTLTHKKYIAIAFPFLLNLFLLIILVNTGMSPVALGDPSQPSPELFPHILLFEYIVLFGLGLYMYIKGSKRDEKEYDHRLQIKFRNKEIHE
jgi:hypothetical protein